jgi:DNA-binding SARP family transcriptional activator
MKYEILGTLQVLDGDVQVAPSAPKLQSTLAMLVVHHNKLVSRTTLIDDIWPVTPPESAMLTLNSYIYQVRRLLASGPSGHSDVLNTRRGGYELIVPPENIDLSEFENRVASGRSHFAAGRFEDASCQLRSALQLRRGPVLAGVEKGPLLAGIAARIEEDTLDAISLRIEIDLRLGRHRELIGELSGLVSQYPMNEDLYAKLMVSLYRSDRRSVALETYQRLRRSLGDHFGIDPSPRLKRLHQDILSDAPSLLEPASAGVLA